MSNKGDKSCPHCETTTLIKKEYEEVEIDECVSCHGIWLDEEELIDIVEARLETIPSTLQEEVLKEAKPGISVKERERIMHCPSCGKELLPNNYNYSSGIIIDFCPSDCGVWLDKGELEKVQAFKERWETKAPEVFAKLGPQLLEVTSSNDERATKRFESGVDLKTKRLQKLYRLFDIFK